MNVLVEEQSLQDIANAIREKNGTEETYKPSQMADAVRAIESGGSGWKETEITSTVSNVYDLMLAIVGGEFKSNTCYYAMLSNVKEADYQYNQVAAIVVYPSNNQLTGLALRYRNGVLGSASFNTTYDAYADIGTIYRWGELEVN